MLDLLFNQFAPAEYHPSSEIAETKRVTFDLTIVSSGKVRQTGKIR